jgi:hypothetical protein
MLRAEQSLSSKTQLLTLYFLDSGAYSAGYLDWLGAHPTAYDWIRDTQTNWFLQESGQCPKSLVCARAHPAAQALCP